MARLYVFRSIVCSVLAEPNVLPDCSYVRINLYAARFIALPDFRADSGADLGSGSYLRKRLPESHISMYQMFIIILKMLAEPGAS